MHCFLTGKFSATPDSLKKFDVPFSDEMQHTDLADYYRKGREVSYSRKYSITPPKLRPQTRKCEFSGKQYVTDQFFEDFGFDRNVSPESLLDPNINIPLSVNNLKPVWRRRKD